MIDRDITQLQLDVYLTREGPWSPEHGDIEIPDDWGFLPSGDATGIEPSLRERHRKLSNPPDN